MTKEEKNMAIFSHAGTLLGYVAIIGNFIVPMLIWLFKHEESDTIARHARASLNFQITVLIIGLVAWLISWVPFIGSLSLWGVALFNIICVVIASIKANDGELFDYPAYPFFK